MDIRKLIIGIVGLAFVAQGCGKFDRSKIAMPKFTFITSENVHDIACAANGRVWICGNYGTVCTSTDGGKTWSKQTTGIDTLLLGSICFPTPTTGWTAGMAGTIIHTTDAGATWRPQHSGTDKDLLDLFFLDTTHGWAVGEFGTIIHTTDGGKTWKAQGEQQDKIFNDIFFVDNQTGWIVGEFGTILSTRDAGTTWQQVTCPDLEAMATDSDWEKPLPALYELFFTDPQHGWIAGMDGVILLTEDSGTTWRRIPSGTDKPIYSLVVRGTQGWAVGNKGVYLRSTDGGRSWKEQPEAIKTKFWLRSIAFCDERNGYIVGARGTVAQTANGGESWDIISGFRYDMEEFGLADF